MRILSEEEKKAHNYTVVAESLKGLLMGAFIGVGTFFYVKRFRPVQFKNFNSSVKAAMMIMPTITFCSFYGEEGSRHFDTAIHSTPEDVMRDYNKWRELPLLLKIEQTVSNNVYKVITGVYFCGIFAAKELASRKIGQEARKVASRNYVGGVTVAAIALLIAVSRKDVRLHESDEWKKFLEKKPTEIESTQSNS